MVGDVGVVEALAALGVGDGRLAPVDFQRAFFGGEGGVVDPAIFVVFPPVGRAFDPLLEHAQFAAGLQRLQPAGQVRVGLGLAGEEVMEAVQQGLPAEGLVGEQIVAQEGDVGALKTLGVGGQPAFGGGDFTVLLFMAVLRGDELRGAG